jgi:hypothetical protein
MLLKKIFWFWWRKKKKSDSEFLSYNLLLNSGNKIRALREKKIITLVLSEKFWTKQKTITTHPSPCKLNGRSLIKLQPTFKACNILHIRVLFHSS